MRDKLTDNEIIKALPFLAKYCKNEYNDIRVDEVLLGAFDLINRQKAELDDLKRDDLPRCKDALRRANEIGIDLENENKELRVEIEKLELLNASLLESCVGYSKACDTYKAEIERLNEYISRCKSGEEYWVKCLLERPNEAIKEFAERLKETKFWNGNEYVIYADNIDVLAKEKVGDNNE